MAKKALAVVATAVMGASGVLAASPASAVTSGAYSQNLISPLICTGHVYDDGDGGTLSVEVTAGETRLSDKHFRTWVVKTRIVAQEKQYDGTWKDVAAAGPFKGKLGPAINAGAVNVSSVYWGTDSSPILTVGVAGFDDLFRAKVVTRFFDDEGVLIKRLVSRSGQCRL